MSKGKGTSSTSFSNIEWVTLISKDDYKFVIDKRIALRSIFIRSMLGESNTSNATKRRGNRKSMAAVTIPGPASGLLKTVDSVTKMKENGQEDSNTIEEQEDVTFDSMGGRATPPPAPTGMDLLSNTNGQGDPEGYVNPFAVDAQDTNNDEDEDDDDDDDDELSHFQNGFAEAQTNTVHFPDIRGIILEKVVEYLCWNARYFDAKDVDIPFFEHRIRPEIAVELLMAADFLEEDY